MPCLHVLKEAWVRYGMTTETLLVGRIWEENWLKCLKKHTFQSAVQFTILK